MPTAWFSFGYDHRHEIDGVALHRNTIARVTAPDPRALMLALFGTEWSSQYREPPTHELMRDLPVVDVWLRVRHAGAEPPAASYPPTDVAGAEDLSGVHSDADPGL